MNTTTKDSASPDASTKAKAEAKKTKHTKLELGADTFCLGSGVEAITESRWFQIYIPSDKTLGTDEEAVQVRQLAMQLADVSEAGVVVKLGIRSGLWEIVLALPTPQEGDKVLLSNVSRALKPVTDACQILKSGFSAIKLPRWAYLIGNFVSADGLFL